MIALPTRDQGQACFRGGGAFGRVWDDPERREAMQKAQSVGARRRWAEYRRKKQAKPPTSLPSTSGLR